MAATADTLVTRHQPRSFRRIWQHSALSLRIGAMILLAHLVVARSRMGVDALRLRADGHRYSALGHELDASFRRRSARPRRASAAPSMRATSTSCSPSAARFAGLVVGAVLGLLSGYLRGPFDEVLQRLNETLISIPFLVLALIAIAAAGPRWAGNPVTRHRSWSRSSTRRASRAWRGRRRSRSRRATSSRSRACAAKGRWSVMWHELLPNATGVLLVEFALRAGYAPILIGSLGFLGFGMRPPTPEWGLIDGDNRNVLMISPVTVLGPGVMLASLVVGLNLFTEGLARILGRTVRIDEA